MNLLGWLPASIKSRLRGGAVAIREACRRAWIERNSGWRAIAPAWPAAFGAIAAIVALCVTQQGLEALLVTVTLEGAETNTGASFETLLRYWIFLGALVVFCVGVIASSLFVMAVERSEAALEDDSATAEVRLTLDEDPIHASVELRTRTAFIIGLATPFALLMFLTAPLDFGVNTDGVVFGIIRWAMAVSAALAVYWLCKLLEWPTVSAQRRLRDGYRRFDPKLVDPYADRPNLFQAFGRFAGAVAITSRYKAATFFNWMFKAPHRHGIALLAAFVVFAVSRDEALRLRDFQDGVRVDEQINWISGGERGALGIALAGAVIAFLFLFVRHRAMKVLELREGRRLIFDRVFQTSYRGFSFLVVVALFGVLWLPALGFDSHGWLGSATLLLAGLSILVSFFVWLVRNAIETPVVVVVTLRPRLLAPFYEIGRFIERIQYGLTPIWIIGFGLLLFTLDKVTLPILEASTDGEWWVWIALLLALVITAGGVSWLILVWRKKLGGRPRRKVMRLASAVVLAPFAFATLGQNHQVASVARGPAGAPVESIASRADRWLEAAVQRADRREECAAQTFLLAPSNPGGASVAAPVEDGDAAAGLPLDAATGTAPPIVAVVVLAEGGGLRASSQAGQLLAALEVRDELTAPAAGCGFFENIYALSGVSGGAVGVATYLAARAERNNSDQPDASADGLRRRIRETLARDHLSALFGGMFASDVMTTIVPVELPTRIARILSPPTLRPGWWPYSQDDVRGLWDRADFFERGLSGAWADSGGQTDWFEMPLEFVTERAAGARRPYSGPGAPDRSEGQAGGVQADPAPVVVFGAFGADDGAMTAASNVAFAPCGREVAGDGAPSRADAGLIGLSDCFFRGDRALPLSTAAHLSARFPGSNPPGVLPVPVTEDGNLLGWGARHVVDGGYFDNSGSAAAAFAVKELHAAADRMDEREALLLNSSDCGGQPCAPQPCDQSSCFRQRLRIVVLHILTPPAADGNGDDKATPPTFPEITTPFSAVLLARDNSGRLPLDSFCRLVASDPQQAEKGCDDILKLSGSLAGGDVSGGKGVYWIRAPLIVSEDRLADNHVLLGWMLGEKSHLEIGRQMNCIADDVIGSIAIAKGRVPPVRLDAC